MATIKPISVPPKKLSRSITSVSSSFRVNNIKSWARNSLGVNINLTASDFGTRAFCVFRNDTGTKIEIMEFDPTTIASSDITILKRGLGFNGDLDTETTAYKLDWSANETTVNFGTDAPQLLNLYKTSYTLQGSNASFSPSDATTYYWGSVFASSPGSTADQSRIYIPKTGVITKVYVYVQCTGTLGSSETSTISLRLNNTTDTTISSSVVVTAISQVFSATVNIAVTAGDYFEMKWVTPTWVTNPTSVRLPVVVYIE